ncbi:MAG: hypothetical protein K6U80_15685 [Firmicutes bacterium]|nr:hypothetical protein [Bacillota bacterium]
MEGSKTAYVLDDIQAQFKVFGENLEVLGNEMKERIARLREKGNGGYRDVETPVRHGEGMRKE